MESVINWLVSCESRNFASFCTDAHNPLFKQSILEPQPCLTATVLQDAHRGDQVVFSWSDGWGKTDSQKISNEGT